MADPTPTPVPVVPSTHFAISKQALAIIGIVGFMAIMLAKQFGWITDSQAAQLELIRQQLLAQQQYSTVSVAETKGGTSVVTVETGGKPADVKPVVSAVTPEQIKQWADIFLPIIKQVIQELRPVNPTKPDPKPEPFGPIVTPPDPQPPTPIDGNPKLVVSDGKGIAITAVTIDTGRLFRVMLSQDVSDVSWKESAFGGTDVWPLPKGLGYDCQFRDATGVVEVTATILVNGKLQQLSARVSALNSPMPPPTPNVDPVNPIVPVDKTSPLRVLMIFESGQNNTDAQLKALNSTRLIAAMNVACAKDSNGVPGWRRWDKDLDVSKDVSPWPALFSAVKSKMAADPSVSLPVIAIVRGNSVKLQSLTSESQALALVQGSN